MVTFVTMIGIEGSGRTKFAREKLVKEKGHVLVSSDDIGREFQNDEVKKAIIDKAVDAEYEPVIRYQHPTLPLSGKAALRETILSEMVLEEVLRRIQENIKAGRDVVWDGTNLISRNRKSRNKLIRQSGECKVVYYWMNLPPHRCAANLASKLVPMGIDLKLLTSLVEQRNTMLEPPTPDEGYDEMVEVTEERFGIITE
jgi:predicted kinase